MVELYGKMVRVWVYRENNDIFVEIANVWDPLYEHPVVLITDESRLKEDVEALIEEIAQLLRKVVERVARGEVR
jgi:hypothetical protein